MWFPRPTEEADVLLRLGSSELDESNLVALVSDPEAEEWRDKVGAAGPAEGSAKATTRLLFSRGWVLKTDTGWATPSLEEALARARTLHEIAARIAIWHPKKTLFVIRSEGLHYPLTACPGLLVVRRLQGFGDRVDAWARMLALTLEVGEVHGVGLDVHPSNFGLDGERLYYLDDEVFARPNGMRSLGESIASRIPEEELEADDGWRDAGRCITRRVALRIATVSLWRELEDGISGYPLVDRYHSRRVALLSGIHAVAFDRRANKDRPPARTCVFADVHSNLPALDAVLSASRALDADSYLFLGDLVGYGPHPRECVSRLRELPSLVAIRGNHDQAAVARRAHDGMNGPAREATAWTNDQLGDGERAWLAALPVKATGRGWLAVHGAPRDPEFFYAYVYELTYRENLEILDERDLLACFYGHTHVQFVHRRDAEGANEKVGAQDMKLDAPGAHYLVNPGSVGQPRDGDARAAFAMWDRDADSITFHRADYPIEVTMRDIERAGLPMDLARRLELGR